MSDLKNNMSFILNESLNELDPVKTNSFLSSSKVVSKKSDCQNQLNNDSLIVHDIIMDHFCEKLNYLNTKDANSRGILPVDDKKKDELLSEPRQVYLYIFNSDVDSGLHDTNIFEGCDETEDKVECDISTFLRGEVLEEYTPMSSHQTSQNKLDLTSVSTSITESPNKCGTMNSIKTSEISALISTNPKSAIYSLYSTVQKTNKKRYRVQANKSVARPLFGYDSSTTKTIYESVDNFKACTRAEKILQDISVLKEIMTQMSKAVCFCRTKSQLTGSVSHMEAERVLLLASYKMELLNKELENNEYEEPEREYFDGIMKIQNLKFFTTENPKEGSNKFKAHCYVCLLHSGTTVVASDVSFAEKNGSVIFNNTFEFSFKNLSQFETCINIYSLNLENNRKKMISCFSRRRYEAVNSKSTSTPLEASHGQLLGKSSIGITELSRNNISFKLETPPIYGIADTFEADIEIHLKLNNSFTGFLTITTGLSLWNRRWCSLKGYHLKYWNYPSQEFDSAPIGIIDLRNCITGYVKRVDKTVCAKPRTFVLQIKSEGNLLPRSYFFSADNLAEFKEWKRQINMLLEVLKQFLDCRTVVLDN